METLVYTGTRGVHRLTTQYDVKATTASGEARSRTLLVPVEHPGLCADMNLRNYCWWNLATITLTYVLGVVCRGGGGVGKRH